MLEDLCMILDRHTDQLRGDLEKWASRQGFSGEVLADSCGSHVDSQDVAFSNQPSEQEAIGALKRTLPHAGTDSTALHTFRDDAASRSVLPNVVGLELEEAPSGWCAVAPTRVPTGTVLRAQTPSQGTLPSLGPTSMKSLACASKRVITPSRTTSDFLSGQRRAQYFSTLTPLQKAVQSRWFEWCASALILVNAAVIAVDTQVRAEFFAIGHVPGAAYVEPEALIVIQMGFTIMFFLELMLRWASGGILKFFFTADRAWNCFDVVVVAFSFVELFGRWSGGDGRILAPSAIVRLARAMRVLRLARILRVMRFFRELRLMLWAILRCAKLLCWVMLVLLLNLFIFGTSFTVGTTDLLAALEPTTDMNYESLVAAFGTLDRSMLSLYEAVYGGRDWSAFCEILQSLPGMYQALFIFYVSFSLLAVGNVVTGIFVDSALQCNHSDTEFVVTEERARQKRFEKQVRDVFMEMDQDGAGHISRADFEAGLDDERVATYFQAMQLEVQDTNRLFTLLDFDKSGSVDLDEFLLGCQRLKGESRAYDLAIMQMEIKWLSESLSRFHASVDRQFADVKGRLVPVMID